MQDVLLTVPDLYFCYEVAKTARWAWTTLATRNLHVGIFNSSPAPPTSESFPFESKAAEKRSSAPWLAGAEVARFSYSNIGGLFVNVLCFRHNCSKKDAGKAGGGDIHV